MRGGEGSASCEFRVFFACRSWPQQEHEKRFRSHLAQASDGITCGAWLFVFFVLPWAQSGRPRKKILAGSDFRSGSNFTSAESIAIPPTEDKRAILSAVNPRACLRQ
jgi:hypothetical protein